MVLAMWLTKSDLPKSITVNKKEIFIKTGFRDWIKFECILSDEQISDRFKPTLLLNTVIYDIPKENQEPILEALFSFYRLNKPILEYPSSKNEVAYQFNFDIDLIFAAFLQQYHINLLTTQMHWWEFKSLFNALDENTKFIKVIGYRTMDISKMTKEQKKNYSELKKVYALPIERTENSQKEIEKNILKQLKGGKEDGE